MIEIFIETALKAIAEKGIGPTIATRNLFILSSIFYNIQTFTNPYFVPFDNFPKATYTMSMIQKNYLYLYVSEYVFEQLNPTLFQNSTTITTFLTSSLFQNSEYIKFKNIFMNRSFLNNVKLLISQYISLRSQDNSSHANDPITYPNGNNVIIPNQVIDFSQYNDPLKWTPINTKSYLTPLWGNVNGFLSESSKDELRTFLDTLYNDVNLENETRKVLEKSLVLTDQEKCIAEFWAGAKNTITPPGFWNLFLCSYFKKYPQSLDKESRYFLLLNGSLFQTSIFVWSIKYNYLQARPIQTIRYFFPNQTISYYGGNNVSSSLWVPYQPSTFITPPFPDFVSGHSTFSSVGAKVLSKLIGNDLLKLNLELDVSLLPIVSPLFSNNQKIENTFYLHCFTIFPHCSEVNSSYPDKAITLRYNSWDDMALDAGISRIYGGIHYDVSNYSGYLLGNKIYEKMLDILPF